MIHMLPPRPKSNARDHLDAARWSVLSKVAAAVAVAEGHLSADEACDLCGMDPAELEVWQHVVRDHGFRRLFGPRP